MPDSYDPDQACEDMLGELKEIIHEQIVHFKKLSKEGKLSENEKRTLFELVRQVKQLAKEELEMAAQTPDDVLDRIVQNGYLRKHRAKKKNDIAKDSGQGAESPQSSESDTD
jgi:hypothetical protein